MHLFGPKNMYVSSLTRTYSESFTTPSGDQSITIAIASLDFITLAKSSNSIHVTIEPSFDYYLRSNE